MRAVVVWITVARKETAASPYVFEPVCGPRAREKVMAEREKDGVAMPRSATAADKSATAAGTKTQKPAATPRPSVEKEAPLPAMRAPLGSQSRNASVSPGLMARLGGLVLTEKEASGFVFKESEQEQVRPARWSAIGKAFTPRLMNKSALEKSMARAWDLHREAQFKIIGKNMFAVSFGSEGDWKTRTEQRPVAIRF